MASGKPVVEVHSYNPTASFPMYPAERAGGSSPFEAYDVWLAKDNIKAYVDVLARLSEDYAGGGLTLTIPWSAAVNTGNARWGAAVRRIADDAEDTDTSHTYDYNSVDDAAPSAIGEVAYATITFTNGADM